MSRTNKVPSITSIDRLAAVGLTPGVLAAAGSAAAATFGITAWALRRRAASEPDYPTGVLRLTEVDSSHTGPAVAVLREKYLKQGGESGDLLDSFDYNEILRSFAEVIYVLAFNMATAELDEIDRCDDVDCGCSDEPSYAETMFTAARYLTNAAVGYEEEHENHVGGCRSCRRAGLSAPALQRARLCREIADDVLLGNQSAMLYLHGVPIQAAFDVACSFIEEIEDIWENSPADQIDRLARRIPATISLSERHPGAEAA